MRPQLQMGLCFKILYLDPLCCYKTLFLSAFSLNVRTVVMRRCIKHAMHGEHRIHWINHDRKYQNIIIIPRNFAIIPSQIAIEHFAQSIISKKVKWHISTLICVSHLCVQSLELTYNRQTNDTWEWPLSVLTITAIIIHHDKNRHSFNDLTIYHYVKSESIG